MSERKPFWGQCPTCGHRWPVFYAPIELTIAARLAKNAACPMCGERKEIGIAEQNDGVLVEKSGVAA